MLYQSKFAVAAMMRAEVRHGQREMYQNTRITHSLVDPVVSEMNHGGWNKAETERKRTWVKLWDMFGPEGNREGLRTSSFASQ
jgi:predicted restriction endonuclease